MERRYDLEERLIDFACLIIELIEHLPEGKAANHIGGQLLRSGTAPALNYGEAQSAESIQDFIHKNRVVLKELRESQVNLKIMTKRKMFNTMPELGNKALDEARQLVAIFTKTIDTARKNKT